MKAKGLYEQMDYFNLFRIEINLSNTYRCRKTVMYYSRLKLLFCKMFFVQLKLLFIFLYVFKVKKIYKYQDYPSSLLEFFFRMIIILMCFIME